MKKFKPVTPTQRYKTVADFSVLDENEKPYKPLVSGVNRISSRNNQGRITVRRRGGGHKKRYRLIDFKRDKYEISGKVVSIQYDPNRSSYIALVTYSDGERRYILLPKGMIVGDTVLSSKKETEIKTGNSILLENVPVGSLVHNIELYPGKGGQLVRSAGAFARVIGFDQKYCLLKLPSKETRKILKTCRATLGQVGNQDHINLSLGKAGRSRWLNKRPKVRGVAMNPVDHPHGGGEGRTSGGRNPVTPWGKPTKGYKTRSKKNITSRFILSKKKK